MLIFDHTYVALKMENWRHEITLFLDLVYECLS